MHEEQLYHKKNNWIFGYLGFFWNTFFVYLLNDWLHISFPLASNKAPIICFCLEAQNNVCGVINHVLF